MSIVFRDDTLLRKYENWDMFWHDEIVIEDIPSFYDLPEKEYLYFVSPEIKSEIDSNFIKHVRKNGSRHHVLSYSSNGIICSEKNCIVNKRIWNNDKTD